MKNLWNDNDAARYAQSDLEMRAYTSRLFGANADLVLHGGGNTSVKSKQTNIYGEEEEILFIKGSGWDLKTIEPAGFSPCLLNHVKKLVTLDNLSDSQMTLELKKSLLDPKAPSPSVEAILHGVIPFKFVDHTHTDAVVTISNTVNGNELIKQLFGKTSLILPYTMPGFIVSKQVYEAIKNIDWSTITSIILLHHGVFTFSNSAKEAYSNMIDLVTKAEEYLEEAGAINNIKSTKGEQIDAVTIAKMRKECSLKAKKPFLIRYKNTDEDFGFSSTKVEEIAIRGPVTPDHVISTKRIPAIASDDITQTLNIYSKQYTEYFDANKSDSHQCLDTIPRWVIYKNRGSLVIGPDPTRLKVISDIVDHTQKCIQMGEALGGWKALPEKDIFNLEYWELEQAKLKVGKKPAEFNGKVALVTGAASGIGKTCAENLVEKGCCVVALDINPEVVNQFQSTNSMGLVCDLTKMNEVDSVIEKAVFQFGGIDFIISNAGSFPASSSIEETEDEKWDRVLEINLHSHFKFLKRCIPFLKLGIDPAVVFIGSKNVPAPGPGVASYSVSKAGLVQLARVAAMELGQYGVRVNTVHPNAVFDTGIWSDEILEKRASNYGLSVEEYKKNNILNTEITSIHVAELTSTLLSQSFSRTTGAQIPIDGGNDRVI